MPLRSEGFDVLVISGAEGGGSASPFEPERSAPASAAEVRSKRVLDVAGALVSLVAFAPLMGLAAVLLKLAGDGPVVFWQQRVGRGGQPFWFPKFATMRQGAEELHLDMLAHNDHDDSLTFKMRRDPRVTRLGRVLRILSIDELPQLWSVLRGDMSLVGPRPPLPSEVACYTAAQHRRLDVTPGLTCLWQISGRSEIPFEGQVRLDIEYIESRSTWGDIKILLRTIPAVLSCKGAF